MVQNKFITINIIIIYIKNLFRLFYGIVYNNLNNKCNSETNGSTINVNLRLILTYFNPSSVL